LVILVSICEIDAVGTFMFDAPVTLLFCATVHVYVIELGKIFPPPFDNGTKNAEPLQLQTFCGIINGLA